MLSLSLETTEEENRFFEGGEESKRNEKAHWTIQLVRDSGHRGETTRWSLSTIQFANKSAAQRKELRERGKSGIATLINRLQSQLKADLLLLLVLAIFHAAEVRFISRMLIQLTRLTPSRCLWGGADEKATSEAKSISSIDLVENNF